MRVVNENDPLWLRPGIASTHVATLFDCSADGLRKTPLLFWADRVSANRRWWIKEMKKVGETELPQGSRQWLQWRAGGVGGSEVATVCGKSRYGSRKKIWEEKTAAARGEEVESGYENEHMKRGKKLEPVCRNEYMQLMGWRVTPLCVLHDIDDYMRCSLDGLRDDEKLIVEIKAPGAKNHATAITVRDSRDPIGLFQEEIPHYYCQMQYQMLITDVEMCHFVSYNEEPQFRGGNRMVLVEVPANKPYQEEIERRVREFWEEYVRPEIPPPSI